MIKFGAKFNALIPFVGCGNGWVRNEFYKSLCNRAVGIDSKQMMAQNQMVLAQAKVFELIRETFDLIHSMEVMYI